MFAFLDINGDGLVDVDELYLAIYGEAINPPQEETPENIFNEFDWDQNGLLDFNEAAYAFFTKFPEASADDFISLWEAADLDNDN